MEVCAQYITLSNRMNLSKNELVSEVHSYIQKHYDQKLTIDDLCRQFFCSRASLTRKFRETYHISIHDYICQVRLENGCRLLRGTSLSIGEIAFLRLWGPKLFYPGLLPDLWDDTHAVQEKENDIIDLCFHHIPLMIPNTQIQDAAKAHDQMGFHFSFRSTAKAARNNPAPTQLTACRLIPEPAKSTTRSMEIPAAAMRATTAGLRQASTDCMADTPLYL